MAFRKIRETVAALQSKPTPTLTAYEQELKSRFEAKAPANIAVNLGVRLAVVIPALLLLNALLSQVFHVSTETTGMLSVVLAYVIAVIHPKIIDGLFGPIPFHKLNPYFGSKLEETIAAFRRSSSEHPRSQSKAVATPR